MPPPEQQQQQQQSSNNNTRKQFLVPPNSTLAQVVTETYYFMLTRGMVQELLGYFTSTAQKSLTVGSAHAVCHSQQDFGLQLQSFVGIVVQIKGVLQQNTVHQGVLVLITGTCVQPHALPFCHSLLLVPTSSSSSAEDDDDATNTNGGCCGFQIQNDALCFLTADAPTAPTEEE
jgi:hypothetical protein